MFDYQRVNIPNWPTRWFLMIVYGLRLIEGFALSEKNSGRKIIELKLCWVVRVGKCRTTWGFLTISVGDEKSKNPQFGDVGHLPHVPPPGGSTEKLCCRWGCCFRESSSVRPSSLIARWWFLEKYWSGRPKYYGLLSAINIFWDHSLPFFQPCLETDETTSQRRRIATNRKRCQGRQEAWLEIGVCPKLG